MRGRSIAVGIAVIAALGSSSAALGASPTTPRHDGYYEIWCTTLDGSRYLAKRVDDTAIQYDKTPGGKDTATAEFNEHNPFGDVCAPGDVIQP